MMSMVFCTRAGSTHPMPFFTVSGESTSAFTASVSAFATVGLSMNLTPTLSPPARVVLIVLMFVGRVGTITVASALALTSRPTRYRYPEGRPIVG